MGRITAILAHVLACPNGQKIQRIIGKTTFSLAFPFGGAAVMSLGEWDDMIDMQIARIGKAFAGIRPGGSGVDICNSIKGIAVFFRITRSQRPTKVRLNCSYLKLLRGRDD